MGWAVSRGSCTLFVPERVAIPLGLYLRLSHLYGYLVSYDCFLVSHIVTCRNLQRGVLGKTKNPFPIFGLKGIRVPELLPVSIYDIRPMEEEKPTIKWPTAIRCPFGIGYSVSSL